MLEDFKLYYFDYALIGFETGVNKGFFSFA